MNNMKSGEFEREETITGGKSGTEVSFNSKELKMDYKNYNDDILYNNLTDEENITILLNYFVEKEFEDAIPLLPPKKELLRGDEERYDDYKNRVFEANKKRLQLAKSYNKTLKQQKEDIIKIVQRSLNKTLGVVFGRAKFVNPHYNAEKKGLLVKAISHNLKFDEETFFQLSEGEYHQIQADFKYMAPRIIFDYSHHELDIRGVMFIYKNKKFFGRFTNKKFEKMKIPLIVDFKKYQELY